VTGHPAIPTGVWAIAGLALAATSLGCETIRTPVGRAVDPTNPDDYRTRPLAAVDDDPWLVRVARGGHLIDAVAVGDTHVYFTTQWEALYAVSKATGAIEVIDTDPNAIFSPILVARDHVYWVKSTYDERDYPHLHLKQRAQAGGATRVLLAAAWSAQTITADSTGVYLGAHDAGKDEGGVRWIPAHGGPPREVFRFEQANQTPSWLLDGSTLYIGNRLPPSPCVIQAQDVNAGGRRQLASVSGMVLGTMTQDAVHIYLMCGTQLWRIDKQTGAQTSLATFKNATVTNQLLVDERNLYLLGDSGDGMRVLALAKSGEPTTPVALSTRFQLVPHLVAQDATHLYLVHAANGLGAPDTGGSAGTTEILVQPKPPIPPPP
jgi:hypothetical protein